MDWVALVSVSVGASVALGGTYLAHVLRSRDERDRDSVSHRRQCYLELVLALGDAHARLRLVADGGAAPGDLRRAAARAVVDSGAYEAREKFLMSANPAVVGAGEAAFRRIIELRDAIRDGARLRSGKYHDAYHELSAATWELRRAVRRDLGAPSISLADVGKPSWDAREHCEVCRSSGNTAEASSGSPTQATAAQAAAPA